jgi:hypothetical protein
VANAGGRVVTGGRSYRAALTYEPTIVVDPGDGQVAALLAAGIGDTEAHV